MGYHRYVVEKTGSKTTLPKGYGVNRAIIRKIELQKENLVAASKNRVLRNCNVYMWRLVNIINLSRPCFTGSSNLGLVRISNSARNGYEKRYGIIRLKISGRHIVMWNHSN